MQRPIIKTYIFLALVCALWLPWTRVQAVPVLPSSFYGQVKNNTANVVDGTCVEALLDGQVLAVGYTQTYQGDSVYALDVRGDDNDTPAQDGGREGDRIHFRVGGVLAPQTGAWHSGTNVSLDLAIRSTGSLAQPHSTFTPSLTVNTLPTVPAASHPITVTPSLPPAAEIVVPPASFTVTASALPLDLRVTFTPPDPAAATTAFKISTAAPRAQPASTRISPGAVLRVAALAASVVLLGILLNRSQR